MRSSCAPGGGARCCCPTDVGLVGAVMEMLWSRFWKYWGQECKNPPKRQHDVKFQLSPHRISRKTSNKETLRTLDVILFR